MTTSTGSGLAYLSWPLSNGELMPKSSYDAARFSRALPSDLRGAGRAVVACRSRSGCTWPRRQGQWFDRAARRFALFGLCLIIAQGDRRRRRAEGTACANFGDAWHAGPAHTLATFSCIAYQNSRRYRPRRRPSRTVRPEAAARSSRSCCSRSSRKR